MMNWKNQFQILKKQTRICKVCFDPIDDKSLYNIFHKNSCLCSKCRKRFKPKFIKFDIDGYEALSIYDYDETIKALLYQFKGCFDYELADVFLQPYYFGLKQMFSGYVLVPIPSFEEDDKIRGFNHVETIFSKLKLPIINALVKTDHFKQAENTSKERKNIGNYLTIKQVQGITNKKVLLVDDVYTTGSTMKACTKLIKNLHPKDIKILVMSKTVFDSSISPI